MDGWWRWLERFRALLRKDQAEREISEEMRFHIDMETRELVATGLDPAEARRRARMAFGSTERYRAEVRDGRWGHGWDMLVQDVRYALRGLRKSPGFTAVVLLSLALGIGANAAIFSLLSAVLMRPLPYGAVDQAVWIRTHWLGSPDASISPAEYLDYKERLRDVFSDFGVYALGSVTITGDGDPASVRAAAISPGVLPALGVQPVLGSGFRPEEGTARVAAVVISDAFWRRRLGAEPAAIGRTLLVDGVACEVRGILPPGFRLPEDVLRDDVAEVFALLAIDPTKVTSRGSHFMSGVARIAPGVSRQQATGALEALAAGFRTEYADSYPAEQRFGATAEPLAERIRGPVRRPLLVLAGAVGFVLLITCANVANLVLARSERRRRELTLRSVLGAGRRRLAGQILVENALLAGLGGLLGVGLAVLLTEITQRLPLGIPWLRAATIDGWVLLFSFALTAATGLLFGLAPALRAGGNRLTTALQESARTSVGSIRGQRLRRSLVIVELAVCLVLLAGAGLLGRSFVRLLAVDPGFRTAGVLTASLELPRSAYGDNEAVTGFYRDLTRQLAELPGVSAAGAVTNLPLASRLGDMDFEIEGRPLATGAVSPVADWQTITPGYFDALGQGLIRGRGIEAHDLATAPGVVVINEALAELQWPGQDPVGQRIHLLGDRTQPAFAEVVGIVRDVRHENLAAERRPQMYFAHEQFRFWGSARAVTQMTLALRSALPRDELRAAVVGTVRGLDADLPLAEWRTMDEVRRQAVALPRLLMGLVLAFSLLALVIAAIGIYGVMAHAVGQRIPEFGLRMALGARPADLTRGILGQGLVLSLVGIAIGLAGALALGHTLSGLLFDISPSDPTTLAAVAIVLGACAVIASWTPARRAARTDPASLLRTD